MYKKSKQIFVSKADKKEADKYKNSAKSKRQKEDKKDCNC